MMTEWDKYSDARAELEGLIDDIAEGWIDGDWPCTREALDVYVTERIGQERVRRLARVVHWSDEVLRGMVSTTVLRMCGDVL